MAGDANPNCCNTCEAGQHWLDGHGYCVEWVPTGFETETDAGYELCEDAAIPLPIAHFIFVKGNTESDAKSWNYSRTCTGSNEGATVSVDIHGGALDNKYEATDPFISDRGAWFNGRTDFMTIEGMTLSDSWRISMWIRALCSGTLFSQSNSVDYAGEEKSVHWGIRNDAIEFEDKVRNYYW